MLPANRPSTTASGKFQLKKIPKQYPIPAVVNMTERASHPFEKDIAATANQTIQVAISPKRNCNRFFNLFMANIEHSTQQTSFA